MCEGTYIHKPQTLRILLRLDRPPPGFEIPRSATVHTNQTKYIILSLYLFTFCTMLFHSFYFVSLLFSFNFLISKGKGGAVVPPPPHLLWIRQSSLSIPPHFPHHLSQSKNRMIHFNVIYVY